jgi:hypothetical protein
MTLLNRYLIFDPGFARLMLGLRGGFIFLFLLLSGYFLFNIGTVSILFVSMGSIFALVNLFAITPNIHFKSSARASVLIYSALLLGLYFPFPDSFKIPFFLTTVFLAYYITRLGQGWFFHPVVASILLMVTMSLPINESELAPINHFVFYCLCAFLMSLFLQFFLFKSRSNFAILGSLQSVLHCLEQSYKKIMDGKRKEAKNIWKRANDKTNLLIQYSRQINKSFEEKKALELFTIELYGLVRLTLNLLDSMKELEKTLVHNKPFRKKINTFIKALEKKVEALLTAPLSNEERKKGTQRESSYLDEKAILPSLLATLPKEINKEELSPLYLFCFSYRRSLEILEQLSLRMTEIGEAK